MKEENEEPKVSNTNKNDIIVKLTVFIVTMAIVLGLFWYFRGNDIMSSGRNDGEYRAGKRNASLTGAHSPGNDTVKGGIRTGADSASGNPVSPLNTKDNSVVGMGDVDSGDNDIKKREGVSGKSNINLETANKIRTKVSETKGHLRSIHVGLESYLIDYGDFPDKLYSLTSPIAYLTTVPLDPFDEEKTIQWTVDPVEFDLFLWSIGPDGIDDAGLITYDPTNGIDSSGDIVRNVRILEDITDPLFLKYFPAFKFFQEGEHREKLDKITLDFQLMVNWIYAYSSRYVKVPDGLENLYELGRLVRELPLDPYGKGTIYRYRKADDPDTEDTYEVIIYSVGPDEYDDGGAKLTLDHDFPVGDIVKKISIYLGKDKKGYKDPFMTELQRIKKETGKDNAMFYYQSAAEISLPLPENQWDTLKNTMENGWGEGSEALLPYFDMYAEAFDLIRAGVEIDNVAFPDPSMLGPETPVPDFLSAQVKSKLLCAQGRYYESLGMYDQALDNYLVALQMGNDYGAENSLLIGGLISFAVKNIACNQIYDFVVEGNLSLDQLQTAGYVLREVDYSDQPITAYMDAEHDSIMYAKDRIVEEIQKIKNDPENLEKMFADNNVDRKLAEDFVADPEKYVQMMEEFHEEKVAFYSQPMWERDYEEWQKTVDWWSERNPLIAISTPNFLEAETRMAVSDANLCIVRTAVALEQYKQAVGAYPNNLSSLTSYLLDDIRDPFTGRPLRYENNGDSFTLYSVGPDKQDQRGKNIYSPTNGTISNGDIIFKSH